MTDFFWRFFFLIKSISTTTTTVFLCSAHSLIHYQTNTHKTTKSTKKAGVIDADYRGPVGVILFNWGSEDFHIEVGDRIAQLILESIVLPDVCEVDDLMQTERGAGGFGSTGIVVQEEKTTTENGTSGGVEDVDNGSSNNKKQRTISPTSSSSSGGKPNDDDNDEGGPASSSKTD